MPLWACGAVADGMNHPLSHLSPLKAPVETVLEGTQVAVGVLFESQGVKRAAEAGFQVAEYRVDPAELRQLLGWRPFTTTG